MSLSVELVEVGGGSGTSIVLGHGLTLDRRSIEGLARALVAEGHRVMVWELPGHGSAPIPAVAWSVEALGAALAASIREASLPPPVLVGVSMAGYASLEAVGGTARLDVAGLVLIGCAGRPQPPAEPPRVAAVAAWAVDGRLDPAVATAMATAELGSCAQGLEDLNQQWSDDAGIGRRVLSGYLALFTRPDPALAGRVVRDLCRPSLVIRGQHDPWVTGGEATQMSKLIGGDLAEVAGAAHQPQFTHLLPTVRAVRRILATVSSRSARDREASQHA